MPALTSWWPTTQRRILGVVAIAGISPSWRESRESELQVVQAAIERELRRRPDGDMDLTSRYHELAQRESELIDELSAAAN